MKQPNRFLLGVLQYMKDHPEEIDMLVWMRKRGDEPYRASDLRVAKKRVRGDVCGTAGCLAGWTNTFFPKEMEKAFRRLKRRLRKKATPRIPITRYDNSYFARMAADVLGVPEDALLPNTWPTELRDRYNSAVPENSTFPVLKSVIAYYEPELDLSAV